MMQKTSIEWTDLSANPLKYRRKSDGKIVWACVKTSPGCAHCYSEQIALRFDRGRLFNAKNMEELEPFLDEKELHEMLTKKTCGGVQVSGSRCFVGDMTDMFGEWVSDELLDQIFAVFTIRSDVTFQVLTKRAERMKSYLRTVQDDDKDLQRFANVACDIAKSPCAAGTFDDVEWPFPNVWLGVSAEDQKRFDERTKHLRETPAAVRFLSIEPLLEDLGQIDLTGIHWVVVGGESGPGSRPMSPDWVRAIRDQCQAAASIDEWAAGATGDAARGIRFMPYTEHDSINTTPVRMQTIHQILDDGGRCDRLQIRWLGGKSDGAIDSYLRTYACVRGSNELVIRSQTTGQAVDYVTDRLRSFAV